MLNSKWIRSHSLKLTSVYQCDLWPATSCSHTHTHTRTHAHTHTHTHTHTRSHTSESSYLQTNRLNLSPLSSSPPFAPPLPFSKFFSQLSLLFFSSPPPSFPQFFCFLPSIFAPHLPLTLPFIYFLLWMDWEWAIKVVNLHVGQIKLSICYVISREDPTHTNTHTHTHTHTITAHIYEQEIRTHRKFISRKNESHTHAHTR